MEYTNSIFNFLKAVLLTTISQLTWLLGLVFIFGFILYILTLFTRQTYAKSVGRKTDIILTGWIGTPVHELGHAIFCIIFGHKIQDIKLYTPNPVNGIIGYVNHTYNPKSTYQKIGNFFIGVGPIIFGAIIIYVALYYLAPNKNEILSNIEAKSPILMDSVKGDYTGTLGEIWAIAKLTLSSLFNTNNLSDYLFWIFLYIAVCISSHMKLSPSDIKGATGGLISLFILCLIINLVILGLEVTGISNYFGSWWNYIKIESYATVINKWIGLLGALFVFASIVSAIHFIVSYILFSAYNLLKGKSLINPLY